MANFFKPSEKKENKGRSLTLNVERLDNNGQGVARYNKKPVFISGALAGEKIVAKIVEQKGKYSRAKIISVLDASVHRVKARCRHFSSCGGCDLQHLDYSQHIAFKQQKVASLFSRNNVNSKLPWHKAILGEPWNYRRKARIGVQYDKTGQVTIGFRQRSTNNLIAIKNCPVLMKSADNIFAELIKVMADLTLTQAIGHIEVIATQHITLVIRQLKPLNESDTKIWQLYADKNQWGIFIDNGKQVEPLTPVRRLHYPLINNIEIDFEVQHFIQVNHDVNVKMVQQAITWLSLNCDDIVLDLFCGLGNFSLPIAKNVAHLVGIEGVQLMVDQADKNAKKNNINNCSFYQADLNSEWGEVSWAALKFNKVLLDPARAGAYEAVQQITKMNIAEILYVSCDPATLAKDSEYLIGQGYQIEKIALMEMFSQTKHIETMVLFSR